MTESKKPMPMLRARTMDRDVALTLPRRGAT
jgi:hypothetical protein